MARYHFISFIFISVLLSSCQTIDLLSIDTRVPADVSFPSVLKNVAIVNNLPVNSDDSIAQPEKKINVFSALAGSTTGNGKLATEELANKIADEKYFDKVIICDSALREKDQYTRPVALSKEEVQQLSEDLGVDLIFSLEGLKINTKRVIQYIPGEGYFQGTVDVKVYPTIRVYIPNRKGPMVTIAAEDSIYWEELGPYAPYVDQILIKGKDVIEEASIFAGSIPIKYLVPTWNTVNRYYYIGGCVEMRDAAVLVRENSWKSSLALWEKVYSTKKAKLQMRSALNIALYYEMNDSIGEAETWAGKAMEIAQQKQKKVADSTKVIYSQDYMIIKQYQSQLEARKLNLAKLKLQMSRFNNDF